MDWSGFAALGGGGIEVRFGDVSKASLSLLRHATMGMFLRLELEAVHENWAGLSSESEALRTENSSKGGPRERLCFWPTGSIKSFRVI